MIDRETVNKNWRPFGFWATTIFLVLALLSLAVGLFVGGGLYDRALEACQWIGGLWVTMALVREGGKFRKGEA